MGISGSDKSLLYALAGVERAGASRADDTSPRAFLSIGGVALVQGSESSLTVVEELNESSNTANVTAYHGATEPLEGQNVVVTLGSRNNLKRTFAGSVINRTHAYVGTPANWVSQPNFIDYTWQLTRRRFSGSFTNTAPSAIAAAIVEVVPGFTLWVESGLPALSAFSQTDVTALEALTALAKAIGGYCDVDYHRVVKLFVTSDGLTAPTDLTSAHVSLEEFSFFKDFSRTRTRIFSEGGGVTALTQVNPGETILPLSTLAWYNAAGGTVKSGAQHLTYSGVQTGGGGSLIGPGSSPPAAPALALASGSGLTAGVYQYAYTDVTASGESLPSPLATITTGTTAAPIAAPTAGAPAAGSGVNDGAHDYEVTFVTSTGETTPSPVSGSVTAGPVTGSPVADPTNAPTGAPTAGVGMAVGTRSYAYSFVTAAGETLPSPTVSIDTPFMTAPTAPVDSGSPHIGQLGNGVFPANQWAWAVTFVGPFGESVFGARVAWGNSGGTPGTVFLGPNLTSIPLGPAGTTARNVYRTKVQGTVAAALSQGLFLEGTISDNTTTTWAGGNVTDAAMTNPASTTGLGSTSGQNALNAIATGPAGTTARKVWRTDGTGPSSQLKLVTTIANNTATSYTDATPDASLGANAPTSNTTAVTTGHNQIPLTAILIGDATVTSRKLYRRFNGSGTFKLVTTIANNTATTYTDTTANASLGADAPSSNTATANRVTVSGIGIGASPTTSRKVYRTAVGASQLKLLATIADNTTLTYADSTADGSLGANVPTGDTSALTQPIGQVLAGSPTLLVAGAGAFSSSGGWALLQGGQFIRYTGLSGNSLTGIPATGVGSITATVAYNTTITASPAIAGIPSSGPGSVVYSILQGDQVNLLVQVDDLAAQTALAALMSSDGIVDDGIIEDYIIDGTIGETEARARATARLALLSTAQVTLRYKCRDKNQHAGGLVTVSFSAPTNISGEFRIQHVTISRFLPGMFPLREVEASNDRFSLEDLLRVTRQKAA